MNWLSCFRFKIKRLEPSGFEAKNILDKNWPLTQLTLLIAPFSSNWIICSKIWTFSCGDHCGAEGGFFWTILTWKGILNPPTQLRMVLSDVNLDHCSRKKWRRPHVLLTVESNNVFWSSGVPVVPDTTVSAVPAKHPDSVETSSRSTSSCRAVWPGMNDVAGPWSFLAHFYWHVVPLVSNWASEHSSHWCFWSFLSNYLQTATRLGMLTSVCPAIWCQYFLP